MSFSFHLRKNIAVIFFYGRRDYTHNKRTGERTTTTKKLSPTLNYASAVAAFNFFNHKNANANANVEISESASCFASYAVNLIEL